MYLAEAEAPRTRSGGEPVPQPLPPSARWQDFPYSRLSDHGAACCDIARAWVVAMDFAQLNGGEPVSGPRWLRQRYKWGPSPWPIHWCEVVKRKTIDCGAHAALAHEAFTARGLTAFPAQLVQRYSDSATEQWRSKWAEEDVSCHWLDGDHIYHEATALLVGEDEVRIWDSSAGSWVDSRRNGGYGSVAAVRIFVDGHSVADGFAWGERRLKPNIWVQLAGCDG